MNFIENLQFDYMCNIKIVNKTWEKLINLFRR